MTYRVEISPQATKDSEELFLFLRDENPEAADRWLSGLIEAVYSLEDSPRRCGLAFEAEAFEREVRQLIYGRNNNYRILFGFRLEPEYDEEVVEFYRIRHTSRQYSLRFGQE